jgi:TolB-like protein/Tfp pilus assembly protein PilF
MHDPPRPRAVPTAGSREDRLESWKEIAAYLEREVRTVQGWEKNEALPVHRHQHARQGSVFAFRSELDRWQEQRRAVPERVEAPAPAETALPRPHVQRTAAIIAAGFVVLVAAVLWIRHLVERPSSATVAVLPFVDMSRGHDHEYFSDGLTEEIIDALSRVPNIHVVARTSAFAFKGKANDIREIGRQLNVERILEGSVRTDGDHLRVTAQLNRVSDGYHIWSHTYDRRLEDIFEVQRDISQAIADQFRAGQIPQRESAKDLETWRLYQEGRYFLNQFAPASFGQAIKRAQDAISRHGNFAPAWALMAEAHAYLAMNFIAHPRDVMPMAEREAEKAVALDPNLAEAHIALGIVKLDYDWERDAAQNEFRRSIELEPGSGYAHHWLAHCLEAQRRLPDAILEMRRALDLDPLSVPIHWDIGMELMSAGKLKEAAQFMKQAAELFPNNEIILSVLADADHRVGDSSGLNRTAADLQASGREDATSIAIRGRIAAWQGHREDAELALQRLEQLRSTQYVEPVLALWVAEAANDRAKLRRWFDRAREERSALFIYLPVWESATSDPEFKALLATI